MYGGLRRLVEDETKDVYRTSRKYEIYDNEKDGLKGLITVEGGKYTTSRGLAENLLKMVTAKTGTKYKKSVTAGKYLAGCEIPDIDTFVASAKSANSDFSASTVDFLSRIYGTEFNQVMDIARSNVKYATPLDADGEMLAQVLYSLKNEMACTLTDILIRRTGVGTLGNPGPKVIEAIAEIAARELNWNTARLDRELEKADAASPFKFQRSWSRGFGRAIMVVNLRTKDPRFESYVQVRWASTDSRLTDSQRRPRCQPSLPERSPSPDNSKKDKRRMQREPY